MSNKFKLGDDQLELLLASVETVLNRAAETTMEEVTGQEIAEYGQLMEMRTVLRKELNDRGLLRKAPCDEHAERITKLINDLADLKSRVADVLDLPRRVEALETSVMEMSSTMERTPMAGTGFARNYQDWQTRVQKVEDGLAVVKDALASHGISKD